MASNDKRLIEVAFPLKQTSLDSVHEKNMRHGHISTLHIWPARRPLAASRAALVATLLRDSGSKEERAQVLDRLAGKIVDVIKKKKLPSGKIVESVVQETLGGILHWGRESGPDLEWFRRKIREAFDGRAPRVLDPFAGGGAIPLEAMRLGCEVTAVDLNPVANLILKCTLEHPQQLAGQHRPLPNFALQSPEFMEHFFKGTGKLTKKQLERNLKAVQDQLFPAADVDLAWHVRAWGWWVLQRATRTLDVFYPMIDSSPTVAYLWARTVKCKSCRATIPLLKTKWLCRKDNKRVLLTMNPNSDRTGVEFGVDIDVKASGGNTAQRRELDKRLGAGTMSRSGVSCPCCTGTIMTMEEIRAEGVAGKLGVVMTAVVVDGKNTKDYRPPTSADIESAGRATHALDEVYSHIPHGRLMEPIKPASTRSISCDLYGIDNFSKAFTDRQQLSLGTLVIATRAARAEAVALGYPVEWANALFDYLCVVVDRVADRSSVFCRWDIGRTTINNTFSRFSLPMLWDFCEGNPISDVTGGYSGALEWVAQVVEHCTNAEKEAPAATIICGSATDEVGLGYDLVLTDPPYYQAISYADLSDFFYIWLKRLRSENSAFSEPLSPKEKEAVQHIRSDKIRTVEKAKYESRMSEAFSRVHDALRDDGLFGIVFAHKDPEAWETLAAAMIRSGFVVTASWPIQTEMGNRGRAQSSAALASSLWLICEKRPSTERPGWDNTVLAEMRERIQTRLREYWDAGIRGPDFVWAATGPALEIYSKHPIVKKANSPGEVLAVSEFLGHVRRFVVEFIVGQVLTMSGGSESVGGLDDLTTYYILHRYDFRFDEAPIGACILYAVSCGLTDRDLCDRYELLSRSGSTEEENTQDDDDGEEDEGGESAGAKVRLKAWNQRLRKSLGEDLDGKPAPLIDQIHKVMRLWRAGDVVKVNDYLDARALRRNSIFGQLLQALIELSPTGSEERSILESVSNHVMARGVAYEDKQMQLES
jgi:adenine-specific DNA methylase